MRISAKELVKQVPKRGGFQPDVERNNGIHFSTPENKKLGAHYVFLRIGQELARKAGLAAGDDVNLEWDDETGEGWISPLPAGEGWKLVSGNPRSDTPSLVLRMRGDLATYDWRKLSRKKWREIGNLELEQD